MKLVIELSYECQLQCKHCSSIGINSSLSLLDIQQVLTQFNIEEIILSGGEPTLHPQFKQIVEALVKKYKVSLYTNGLTPLTDSMLLKFYKIYVSVYGWEQFHNSITSSQSFRESLYFLISTGIQMHSHHHNKESVIVNSPIFGNKTQEVVYVAKAGDFPIHLTRLLPHGRAGTMKVLNREKQLQIAEKIKAEYPNTTISQSLLHNTCNWKTKFTLLPNGGLIHCVAGKHNSNSNQEYVCDKVSL